MKKNLATMAIAVLSCALAACSAIPKPTGPVAADPFPLKWQLATSTDNGLDLQLCWTEKTQNIRCLNLAAIDTQEKRNNFQHALFGIATSLCADFRAELANQPKKALWVGIVSELLSAASPVLRPESTSKAIAAGGSFTSITASEIDSYLDAEKIEIALLGIELARTDIFKSVIDNADKDLDEYPAASTPKCNTCQAAISLLSSRAA